MYNLTCNGIGHCVYYMTLYYALVLERHGLVPEKTGPIGLMHPGLLELCNVMEVASARVFNSGYMMAWNVIGTHTVHAPANKVCSQYDIT